jgi:two-component system, OmpR family, response regulator
MENKTLIFLVDDDPMFSRSMVNELSFNPGFRVRTFPTGEEMLPHLSEKPDIIFLDYVLNSRDQSAMNGLHTLKKIRDENPRIPVVMLSSQEKVEVAVNCMKNDAVDYIVKNESASMRANNVIRNIFRYREMEKDAIFYKRAGLSSFVFVSAIIFLIFILSMFFPESLKNIFGK